MKPSGSPMVRCPRAAAVDDGGSDDLQTDERQICVDDGREHSAQVADVPDPVLQGNDHHPGGHDRFTGLERL